MGVRTRLLAVVGMVMVAVAVAAPAGAHTELVGSSPSSGQRVLATTDQLVLEFASPVLPHAVDVRVTDANGAAARLGSAQVADTVVVVPLELGRLGRYDVAYRAMAADGHAVTGGFSFTAARDGTTVAVAAVSPGGAASQVSATSGTQGRGRVWIAIAVAAVLIAIALHRAARTGRARDPR